MKHIILSPHLDDAIFSCGGLINNLHQAGEAVTVINVCAGQPQDGNLSPFALEYHRSWGNSPDPVGLRLEEDHRALSLWSIQGIYWPTPDSIYRVIDGKPAYPDQAALFGPPQPQEEQDLLADWQSRWQALELTPDAVCLYAPLGAGGHVDHVLVSKFARSLDLAGWKTWYYEDFPHAYDQITLNAAFLPFGQAARYPHYQLIDLQAKVAAMRAYRSQIAMIFGDEHGLEMQVRAFTAERAAMIDLGERLRKLLAGSGGRRERLWRSIFGYHAFAERYWSIK